MNDIYGRLFEYRTVTTNNVKSIPDIS